MSDNDVKTDSKYSVFAVFKTFLFLGLTSFGGPVAHLGYFRKELVEKQQWVSESQYAQLLSICQFIPGPASSQLGFALGLIRAGWSGALAAFVAFTFPSIILLILFAWLLPLLSGDIGVAIIHGLKLVAAVVVADAVWGMFKKLCPDLPRRIITLVVIIILLLLDSVWALWAVIILGGVLGGTFCRQSSTEPVSEIKVTYSQRFGFVLLTVFFVLLLGLIGISHNGGIVQVMQIFYQAGALVFGGGHVVLPLLQESVVTTGLVSNQDFLAGYGASQAIPGPMFAFSAYLGVLMSGGIEQNMILVAFVALTFMFLPGFLLVAAVLPLWQGISNNKTTLNVIAGVNAAVVGLLITVLYDPILITGLTSLFDVLAMVVGILMLNRWQLSPLLVIVWCLITSAMHLLI
ncbi:chromate efflux transporter [Psychrosphaera aquimarina]|uniref:Chromate efflux transporter n=1 Tax=Psychrosphaera aquimarina TaxID=2044854 RepID=A0ABU3QYT2_9GAMM|nr:chromate efflux transporter [Psychrosphaera aquimarina]MDU0112439.1 chromate efflux transporter [Psychrosphaera aquimarina]